MDLLSPFIPVLCHSEWLFQGESCPCLDVVHPGRAWPSSPACTWHCSCIVSSPGNSLISSWCDHSMLASLPWQQFPVYSSFVKNPVICFLCFPWNPHNLFSPFISEASRHVSSFFLRVKLSQPYVATGHTSAFISRIFVEISMLWLFHIFCSYSFKNWLARCRKTRRNNWRPWKRWRCGISVSVVVRWTYTFAQQV